MPILHCPNCGEQLPVAAAAGGPPDRFFLPLSSYRCGHCGRTLDLYAERTFGGPVAMRLVDPAAEWSADDILRQEG